MHTRRALSNQFRVTLSVQIFLLLMFGSDHVKIGSLFASVGVRVGTTCFLLCFVALMENLIVLVFMQLDAC